MNKLLENTKFPNKIAYKNEALTISMNGRVLNENEYSVSSGVITMYKIEPGGILVTYNKLPDDKYKQFLGHNYYNPRKKSK